MFKERGGDPLPPHWRMDLRHRRTPRRIFDISDFSGMIRHRRTGSPRRWVMGGVRGCLGLWGLHCVWFVGGRRWKTLAGRCPCSYPCSLYRCPWGRGTPAASNSATPHVPSTGLQATHACEQSPCFLVRQVRAASPIYAGEFNRRGAKLPEGAAALGRRLNGIVMPCRQSAL